MGIVKKQTLFNTIILYAGSVIGFVNLILLFPKVFTPEQIGIIQYILAVAVVLGQLSSLGFNIVTLRLFPKFRNDSNRHNGFFLVGTIVNASGVIIVLSIYFIVEKLFIKSEDISSSENSIFKILLIATVFQTFFTLFDYYCRVLYKSVTGTFYKEFLYRILTTVLIGLVFLQVINFNWFLLLFTIVFAIPTVALFIHLLKGNALTYQINSSMIGKYKKEIISVSFYGLLMGFAGIIIPNIDKLMIKHLLGYHDTGIYSIGFKIASVILIPSQALLKITTTFISDAWESNEVEKIKYYQKSSTIFQFLAGCLLISIIYVNLPNIFAYLPREYEAGKWVIILMLLCNLSFLTSGFSHQIIYTSSAYKTAFYFMVLTIIIAIVTNYIFIPVLEIDGAALASLISVTIITTLRLGFISWKFKIQPIYVEQLYAILLLVVSCAIFSIIPYFLNYILDAFIRTIIVTTFFVGIAYKLKISPDLNNTIKKLLKL